jgi:hypothetical protein
MLENYGRYCRLNAEESGDNHFIEAAAGSSRLQTGQELGDRGPPESLASSQFSLTRYWVGMLEKRDFVTIKTGCAGIGRGRGQGSRDQEPVNKHGISE